MLGQKRTGASHGLQASACGPSPATRTGTPWRLGRFIPSADYDFINLLSSNLILFGKPSFSLSIIILPILSSFAPVPIPLSTHFPYRTAPTFIMASPRKSSQTPGPSRSPPFVACDYFPAFADPAFRAHKQRRSERPLPIFSRSSTPSCSRA